MAYSLLYGNFKSSDNYNLKASEKSMEYFKKMMSMMCLFDLDTQEKKAVSLKKYITVQSKK